MTDLRKNAVVMVLDRLSAAYLGPYGNTWLDMPTWNSLASDSFLFDFATSHSTTLAGAYAAYWRGITGASPSMVARNGPPFLADVLSGHGIATRHLTDDGEVASMAEVAGFERIELIRPSESFRSCDEISDTQLGQFFAAALEAMAEPCAAPTLTWLHARALGGLWDAPYEWRRRLVDDEDPDPPTFVEPPSFRLDTNSDPDLRFGITRAYGAQAMLVDACMAAFLDGLLHSPGADRTLFVVTSPRGYPLGEHGRVGPEEPSLYGEQLHVPWLIWEPGRLERFGRSAALVQPADMYATLLSWWGLDGSSATESIDLWPHMAEGRELRRSHAIAGAGHEWAVRTAQWFLRRPADGRSELYVKPDDRFEVNEVSSRCPDVVAQLQSLLPPNSSWELCKNGLG